MTGQQLALALVSESIVRTGRARSNRATGMGCDTPLSRARDPETSKQAGERAASFVAGHEAKCYSAICDAGARGATAKEIERVTGLTVVQVCRRLGDMGDRKLIERRFTPREERDDPISFDYQRRGRHAIWWVK